MSETFDNDIAESVDHLFRQRAGQMIAVLTRLFGVARLDDIEDVVQEAMIQALRQWPLQGQPDNPAAWLIQTAKNRMLDRLRRAARLTDAARIAGLPAPDVAGQVSFTHEIADDQLRMIFICCHPLIPADSRIALTLKIVSGFSVREIARAFLAGEPAIARMLSRAKLQLRERHISLEMPAPEHLPARLEAVLRVIYLMFNEGYKASEGAALVREDLCHEAIRLSDLLSRHPLAGGSLTHALAALLCFQGARLATRCDAAGDLLLLADQDRTRWDQRMLRRGLWHMGHSASGAEMSDYHLEAEIASCHALATSYAATDWGRVLGCYDELLRRRPSPVIALNRVIALSRLRGAAAGLRELETLRHQRALQHYYPLYATEAELLRETGAREAATAAYARALELTSSIPVRRYMEKRMLEERSQKSEVRSQNGDVEVPIYTISDQGKKL